MKIAVWNVERLKHKTQLHLMREHCRNANADILVLTETDRQLKPEYRYCYHTLPAVEAVPELYKDTENRVSIYTNYRFVRQHKTYDEYTAVCVELETERGNLLVYGTIMGIYGNRERSYRQDLMRQMEDIKKLSSLGNICVAGDYNCSFSDDYYFTKNGRDSVIKGFQDREILLLTGERPECIDHIAVSERFLLGADVTVEEWNLDKTLSDHKGIVVKVTWQLEVMRRAVSDYQK